MESRKHSHVHYYYTKSFRETLLLLFGVKDDIYRMGKRSERGTVLLHFVLVIKRL
jgi:hypothetical protein